MGSQGFMVFITAWAGVLEKKVSRPVSQKTHPGSNGVAGGGGGIS